MPHINTTNHERVLFCFVTFRSKTKMMKKGEKEEEEGKRPHRENRVDQSAVVCTVHAI